MMIARRYRGDCDDGDDNEETQECVVRVVGNEVYFYGSVTTENILELNTALRTLENDLLCKFSSYTYSEVPGITLYIQTEGGDIFAGLSCMDHIRNMRVRVTTVADGCCASAGTFMLLGGHHRTIKKHSFVLIHQLSSGFWGKFQELKDETKSLSKFMKTITTMYNKHTTIPKKKLDIMMKKDMYLDADECIKFKIVDEVL